MRYFRTRSVIFYLESYAAPVRYRGLTPPGMLTMSVPVRSIEDTLYFKTPRDDDGLPMMTPGVFEGVMAAAQTHFVVLIDLHRLERQLPDETFQSLLNACAARWLPAPRENIASFRNWLTRALRAAFAYPALLSSAPALQSLEDDLLDRLAALAEPPYRFTGQRSALDRGLHRALEQMHALEPQAVNIPDLCREIQFSQSSLTRAFRRRFDLNPTGYLRMRRLNAVRRCLLQARKGETTVAAIAFEHGFYELGRFAAGYAALFGEPPSITLSRTDPVSIRSVLV
jgi:AraC family transcriptional regulator, ethanolamine operon transcriptional activator